MKHLRLPYPSKEAVSRLLQTVYGVPVPDLTWYYDLTSRGFKHEGPVNTCKYLKDLYVQAIHIALRRTVVPIPFRKSNSKGQAKDLRPYLQHLESGDPNRIRSVLTVLRLCYLIKTRPSVDVASITTPAPEGWNDKQWEDFSEFAHFWVEPGEVNDKILVVPRARSGPNGPSSLLTGHLDAEALVSEDNLLTNLDEMAVSIDSSHPIKKWVEDLSSYSKDHPDPEQRGPVVHSRLSALAEGGCKTRVIAIGDLFSQITLLPIHKYLMNRLARLRQDGTHDQSKSIDLVRQWTKKGPVYSFDLTSATDRFPVRLTGIVMSSLLGVKMASNWISVMTERAFSLPNNRSKSVFYAAGQPMGLYSSWPAFAFSHHVFVKYCAKLEGVKSFRDYTIIGDDVVIAHPSVARRYRTELEVLGVSISESKSLVSEEYPYHAEICKQILCDGVNLSPIPPDLIKVVLQEPSYLYAFLEEIRKRYGGGIHSPRLCTAEVSNWYYASQRTKALILLTAPSAVSPKGILCQTVRNPDYPESADKASNQPWVNPWDDIDLSQLQTKDGNFILDPDQDPSEMPSLQEVAEQVYTTQRELKLRAQFESVAVDWSLIQFDGFTRYGQKARHGATIPDSPFERARFWISDKVEALLSAPPSYVDAEDELFLGEYGIKFVIDPNLRSYQDRKLIKSKSASRLTLETFKVLKGKLPLPEIPRGSISGTLTAI